MRIQVFTLALSLSALTALGQGPAQMSIGAGGSYFMADAGSNFGTWGGLDGGLDGMNLMANINFDMPAWDNYYVRLGSDFHYVSAVSTSQQTTLAGLSPHFGIGAVTAMDNGQLRYGLTMGLSLLRTWEQNGSGNHVLNGSGYGLWGSLGAPAGVSVRYEIPNAERTYYIGADYRYFMFEDGLDGVGGGGNRVNGHDDQMLSFSIGVVNNKTYRSKTLAALESEAAKAEALPKLQEELNKSKEANAIAKDELEVARAKVAEANRKLDSLEIVSVQAQEQAQAAEEAVSVDGVMAELPSASYVVVLGSFKNEAYAKSYRAGLDYGLPVNIVEASNGFFRVFIGPFDNKSAAKEALAKVADDINEAWILSVK